ncbi:MAG: uracil-DNA glycosylase [Terriglobia bacterium]
MTSETRQHIADWLSYFRELGFEDLYRRPASATGSSIADLSRSHVPLGSEQGPPRSHDERIAGPAAGASPIVFRAAAAPTLAPAGAAPRSLSLFESSAAPGKSETLDDIRTDLGDCRRCKLWKGRKQIVFGQGNPHAELMFVGEGPGADEDEQGLPFVGRAGQLLNKMLQLVGIRREDVYICNVVKCRPPGNRTPETEEIEACSPFLFRQIDAVRPRLICCLGAPAARTVLGIKEGITKVHGQFLDYRGTKALATVHPAYVLRNMREEIILREDFTKIRDFLKLPR